jgi:hypothetical protein
MAEPLLTPEARKEVERRDDPDELAERQRWPRTIVWSLTAGAANGLGGLLYGLSEQDALLIGGSITVTVFIVIVVAGWVMKKPVVPRLRGEDSDDPWDE